MEHVVMGISGSYENALLVRHNSDCGHHYEVTECRCIPAGPLYAPTTSTSYFHIYHWITRPHLQSIFWYLRYIIPVLLWTGFAQASHLTAQYFHHTWPSESIIHVMPFTRKARTHERSPFFTQWLHCQIPQIHADIVASRDWTSAGCADNTLVLINRRASCELSEI